MPVDLRARMEMSDQLKAAMARAPEIVAEELTEGMQEVAFVRDSVRVSIQSEGLVESGAMMRTTKAMVYTNRDRGTVRGIVQVGTRGRGPGFYAPVQERGATITPKKGEFLLIPVGERVLITHVQQRSGDWKELKSPRMETIAQKFAKVRSVTIKPTWFFYKGTKRSLPRVEAALDRHGFRAVERVFEAGDASGD